MGGNVQRLACLAIALSIGTSICWGDEIPSSHLLKTVQKSLGLDPSLARVTDASLSDPHVPPDYILIQDIHCLPEAQEEIGSTLLLTHARWGMHSIFLEGAFTSLDLSGYRAIGQASSAEELRARLGTNQWTGAEWVAAQLRQDNFRLSGMEDFTLYRRALDASLTVQKNEDRALSELKELRHSRHNGDRLAKADWKKLELLLQLKARPQDMVQYQRPAVSFPEDLEHTLSAAEDFYRLADARSEVFVQRILSDKNSGPVAVVVGGFHTTAMAQALRKKNVSFIVITPEVTEAPSAAVYHARLQASANALLTPSR